jgi:hypothetical protein
VLLPSNKTLLTKKVQDIKEACRASASQRAALCRLQNQWIETGRANGARALVNKLYAHNDRLASHLFSPSELAFVVDFEGHYDAKVLSMAGTAARAITREWERKDIDMMFGAAVKSSLDYGACIVKQMWGHTGVEARVIMPWQFGVYREDLNSLEEQEALCESGLMTTEEVWRRISHLPDAEKLYQRVVSNSGKESGEQLEGSFFHNVLSTSILNTDLNNVRQQPGGVVQLASNMAMQMIGPEMKLDLVPFHEMYVKDDDREDYVTVLLIEPDILISPYYKRENMFAPKTQPYSLVQANQTPGYLWGRSEIVDLIEPQGLMATWYDDLKRMMALQNDKILAFSGADGISDEKYAEFRGAGFFDLPPGASVNDLTPQFPPQMFQAIETISRAMEEISGFSNILSGQGESGVRAGVHADTLMRAASPRLRDRSLLIERQCAAAADKTLGLMQAKDGDVYRTGTKEPVEFLLHDLPNDRRVTVDSHSSSPIFAEDHKDLVGFGLKAGYLGGDSAIDLLPYPQKDLLRERYTKMQEAKQKLIQEHPEILTKGKGHHA